MNISDIKITGAGSPIVDILAQTDDDFVSTYIGEKGGMQLIDTDKMQLLLETLPKPTTMAAGGSAANTIFALAKLGLKCSFLGKLGNDDLAVEYQKIFKQNGGDNSHFKFSPDAPSAVCLSIVTPDHERTMRTCLRAAATLTPDEITDQDFKGFTLIHIEGYLLFNAQLTYSIIKRAKNANCKISLDLGSFEIVKAFKDNIIDILENYVDIVFANEDEALTFSGGSDLNKALDELGNLCEIAVVKKGAQGSIILSSGKKTEIAPEKVENVIDTTGAGDYWAAGFLFGYLNNKPMEICGKTGSILASEVITTLGAKLPEKNWQNVINKMKSLQ